MFEHRSQPLISRRAFAQRFARHVLLVLLIASCSLFIGVMGYRFCGGLPWMDALLNASMILGGMGPVNMLHTNAGKLFASFYALFSGMVILLIMGVLFAPIIHRLLHHFHFDMKE